MIFRKLLFLGSFFVSSFAFAKVSILTSTPNLKAIVEEVGGTDVKVESFCKGTQDPHFLESKPSYMVKTNQADLVVAIGLGLEVGWLPKVLTGGRNSSVMPGKNGYLEVGPLLKIIEVPTGAVSRADGDVHPEGNPHVTLDPIRAGKIAGIVADRLSLLDPTNTPKYKQRASALKTRLLQRTKLWQQRIEQTGINKVVTYHKTLAYFLDRFHLTSPAILEPFPGVPPTGPHILAVIKTAAAEGVRLILVENYFDDAVAKRVARDLPVLRIETVPVSVGGRSDVKTIDDVYENLVQAFERPIQ